MPTASLTLPPCPICGKLIERALWRHGVLANHESHCPMFRRQWTNEDGSFADVITTPDTSDMLPAFYELVAAGMVANGQAPHGDFLRWQSERAAQ